MIPIISGVIQIGQSYLEGRNEKIKAKAHAEAEVMKSAAKDVGTWEAHMAKNSNTSWKDEYLTILFSIPLVLAFIPPAVPYVVEGFQALDGMPDWYKYTLSIVVGASFAVRSAIGFIKR